MANLSLRLVYTFDFITDMYYRKLWIYGLVLLWFHIPLPLDRGWPQYIGVKPYQTRVNFKPWCRKTSPVGCDSSNRQWGLTEWLPPKTVTWGSIPDILFSIFSAVFLRPFYSPPFCKAAVAFQSKHHCQAQALPFLLSKGPFSYTVPDDSSLLCSSPGRDSELQWGSKDRCSLALPCTAASK